MAPKKHRPPKLKLGDKVWRINFASYGKPHMKISIFPGIVTAIRSGGNFGIYGYEYFLDNTNEIAHWECDLYTTENEAAAQLISIWRGNKLGVVLGLSGLG